MATVVGIVGCGSSVPIANVDSTTGTSGSSPVAETTDSTSTESTSAMDSSTTQQTSSSSSTTGASEEDGSSSSTTGAAPVPFEPGVFRIDSGFGDGLIDAVTLADGATIVVCRIQAETSDGWIFRISVDGSIEWGHELTSIAYDSPSGVVALSDRVRVIFSSSARGGHIPGFLDFAPDGDVLQQQLFESQVPLLLNVYETAAHDDITYLVGRVHGGEDAETWAAAFEHDGAVRWSRMLRAPGYDTATSVAVSPDGTRIAFAGVSSSSGERRGQIGEFSAADGALLTLHTRAGDTLDSLNGIAFAPSGELWAVGTTTGLGDPVPLLVRQSASGTTSFAVAARGTGHVFEDVLATETVVVSGTYEPEEGPMIRQAWMVELDGARVLSSRSLDFGRGSLVGRRLQQVGEDTVTQLSILSGAGATSDGVLVRHRLAERSCGTVDRPVTLTELGYDSEALHPDEADLALAPLESFFLVQEREGSMSLTCGP